MSSYLEKKRKANKESGVKPEKTKGVKSVSKEAIDAPAYGTTPMMLRLNQYHKDIIDFGSKKAGLNKQEFVRIAIRELAEKYGVS